MNNLVDKLANLDPSELEQVVSSAKKKQAEKKKQINEELLYKGIQKVVPLKEFNGFVQRTKALFQGKKYSHTIKLELNLTINRLIAWIEDKYPSIAEQNITVKGNLPKNMLIELSVIFTDLYSGHPDLDKNDLTMETMKKEIVQLCDDIDRREKELGLAHQELWEAIYEKCQKYSHG